MDVLRQKWGLPGATSLSSQASSTSIGIPTFFPSKIPSKEEARQGKDDADEFQERRSLSNERDRWPGRYVPSKTAAPRL